MDSDCVLMEPAYLSVSTSVKWLTCFLHMDVACKIQLRIRVIIVIYIYIERAVYDSDYIRITFYTQKQLIRSRDGIQMKSV